MVLGKHLQNDKPLYLVENLCIIIHHFVSSAGTMPNHRTQKNVVKTVMEKTLAAQDRYSQNTGIKVCCVMVKISSVALFFYPSLGLALQNARVL
jgi:hypothetical protein